MDNFAKIEESVGRRSYFDLILRKKVIIWTHFEEKSSLETGIFGAFWVTWQVENFCGYSSSCQAKGIFLKTPQTTGDQSCGLSS